MTQEKELKYPITIALKVIMTYDAGDQKNISDLDNILEKLNIPLEKQWTTSKSNAGNYMCYTRKVYIATKDIMYALFEELGKHPSVKFAI